MEHEPQLSNPHSATILKELSDIKANLAVNSNETANIKQSISEIKVDVREIKDDSVTRREFSDAMILTQNLQKDVSFLQKIAYGGLSILGAIQFYFNVIHK